MTPSGPEIAPAATFPPPLPSRLDRCPIRLAFLESQFRRCRWRRGRGRGAASHRPRSAEHTTDLPPYSLLFSSAGAFVVGSLCPRSDRLGVPDVGIGRATSPALPNSRNDAQRPGNRPWRDVSGSPALSA